MNRDRLKVAIEEAERFLRRARNLPDPEPYMLYGKQYHNDNFPREQGFIRRSSLDLTRALADLRRP